MLDARLSWAGEPGLPLPEKEVLVPLPNGLYEIEPCRTGRAEPRRRTVEVKGGMLTLTLTPAPVYLIPKR